MTWKFQLKVEKFSSNSGIRSHTMITRITNPLSFVYFFYGFMFFANEDKSIRILRLSIKTTTIVIMLFLICYTLEFALMASKSLYKYSFHLKSWIAFVSFFKVHREMNRIRQILSLIISQLSSKEVHKLFVINIGLTLFWTAMVITNGAIYSWLSWPEPKVVVREILWAIYGFGWISLTVLHLTHICIAIFLIERTLLLQSNILSEVCDNRIHQLKVSYHQMSDKFFALQRLKQSIDDNLGLLPFLWFFELFSSTCLRLTQIASENNQNSPKIPLILEYFYEFIQLSIVYIVYIICLNYFQTRRPTKNDLMVWLNNYDIWRTKSMPLATSSLTIASDNHFFDKYLLSEHLLHCYSTDTYMAWNLFPIDVKFIFGFTGSVVTFAVMFIQLNQQ